MSGSRGRPPRLETRIGDVRPAPPATTAELLERAKVAGPGAAPGRTELRRFVERIVAADRHALGALAPIDHLTSVEAWAAFTQVFGATADEPLIDADRTLAAAHTAAERISEVGATGGRIAFATATPASLLGLFVTMTARAATAGAEVADLADVGPMRADGRSPRWLRWINGVAALTDGTDLCATRDAEPAREWLFILPRPVLVVADGPFAEAAWEAGIEVIAFAGLERGALAIAAARGARCLVVPIRTDRAPRAYEPLDAILRTPAVRAERSEL